MGKEEGGVELVRKVRYGYIIEGFLVGVGFGFCFKYDEKLWVVLVVVWKTGYRE